MVDSFGRGVSWVDLIALFRISFFWSRSISIWSQVEAFDVNWFLSPKASAREVAESARKTHRLLKRWGTITEFNKYVSVMIVFWGAVELVKKIFIRSRFCFWNGSSFVWGVYDERVTDLASTRIYDKHGRNSSRNIHRFVHKKNMTLRVKVSFVNAPIKATSRYKKGRIAQWPVLKLSDWIRMAFEEPYNGFFFCGGHRLHDELGAITKMFENFWNLYAYEDSNSPKYPKYTVPIFLHGDEGRGQCKRPVMVLSYQPLINWANPDHNNLKKNLRLSPRQHFVLRLVPHHFVYRSIYRFMIYAWFVMVQPYKDQ